MQLHDDRRDCKQVYTVELSLDFFRRRWPYARLDRCHRGVDIFRHNNAAVNETVRHVLNVARVKLDHQGGGLRVAAEREVSALAGDEIRLELSDVHAQRTVDTKRCRQEKMDCASRRCKSVYAGRSTSKLRRQMSYGASCQGILRPKRASLLRPFLCGSGPLRGQLSVLLNPFSSFASGPDGARLVPIPPE